MIEMKKGGGLLPVIAMLVIAAVLLASSGEGMHNEAKAMKAMPTPVPVQVMEAKPPAAPAGQETAEAEPAQPTDEPPTEEGMTEEPPGPSPGGAYALAWNGKLMSPAQLTPVKQPPGQGGALSSLASVMSSAMADAQDELARQIETGRVLESIREAMERLGVPDPDDEQGTLVCRAALRYLGREYSQKTDERFADCADCSSLVYMAYMDIGIDLKGKDGVTAASEAEKCAENGWIVTVGYDEDALVPGDILFWTSDDPPYEGRYLDIYHAGIYLGDGTAIEASSREGEVVVREVWGEEDILLTARPLWDSDDRDAILEQLRQLEQAEGTETPPDQGTAEDGSATEADVTAESTPDEDVPEGDAEEEPRTDEAGTDAAPGEPADAEEDPEEPESPDAEATAESGGDELPAEDAQDGTGESPAEAGDP